MLQPYMASVKDTMVVKDIVDSVRPQGLQVYLLYKIFDLVSHILSCRLEYLVTICICLLGTQGILVETTNLSDMLILVRIYIEVI